MSRRRVDPPPDAPKSWRALFGAELRPDGPCRQLFYQRPHEVGTDAGGGVMPHVCPLVMLDVIVDGITERYGVQPVETLPVPSVSLDPGGSVFQTDERRTRDFGGFPVAALLCHVPALLEDARGASEANGMLRSYGTTPCVRFSNGRVLSVMPAAVLPEIIAWLASMVDEADAMVDAQVDRLGRGDGAKYLLLPKRRSPGEA